MRQIHLKAIDFCTMVLLSNRSVDAQGHGPRTDAANGMGKWKR